MRVAGIPVVSANVNAKKAAGEAAADLVKSGMVVGLGTGSTVAWTIKRLGERIKEEGLECGGLSCSRPETIKSGVVTVTNDGIGAAMGTTLTLHVLPGMPDFHADTTVVVGDLPPGGKSLFRIHCLAGPAVNTGEAVAVMKTQDKFQFSSATDTLRVPVQAVLPPALEVANGWIRSRLNPAARRLADAAQVVRGDTTELVLQVIHRAQRLAVTGQVQHARVDHQLADAVDGAAPDELDAPGGKRAAGPADPPRAAGG